MRWTPAICLLSILLPGAARGDDELGRARHLFEFMKFKQSLELAEKVLHAPVDEPARLAEAYKLKGLCLAALGRREQAQEAFLRLLAIDPDAEVSDQLSPKLTDVFYRAAAQTRENRPLNLWHDPPRVRSGENLAGLRLTVNLEIDLFDLIHGIRLRYLPSRGDDRKLTRPVRGANKVVFELPDDTDSTEIDYFFEALNAHGGVVARLTHKGEPYHVGTALVEPPDLNEVAGEALLGPEEDRPVRVQTASPRRTWGHVSFWSGVGLLVLGGVATWQAADAADAYNQSYGDDKAAADRSRTWAGVMYTGYFAGAALVTTGVVLWLSGDPPGGTNDQARLQLGTAPGGGLSMGLRGTW